jgi:hypothetical protein
MQIGFADDEIANRPVFLQSRQSALALIIGHNRSALRKKFWDRRHRHSFESSAGLIRQWKLQPMAKKFSVERVGRGFSPVAVRQNG